jgi:DNA-binding response OmpR family regulator
MLTSKKILAVDDDEDTGEILGIMLSYNGYRNLWTASRDQALQLMVQYEPDLIMMDFLMPGLPIEEFVRNARAKFPATHFLMYSSLDIHQAPEMFANTFWLKKPFDPLALSRTLKSCFASGRQTQLSALEF